jgi:cation transport protein ChaC
VRRAVGLAGSNIDYVLNTVRHLEEAGIDDVELVALAARLGGVQKTKAQD